MQGTAVVTEIVGILVSGITQLGQGIGTGVASLVNALWFTTSGETTTMSVFAIMICVFAAIGLAVGLSRLIFGWLSSLGASR